MIPNSIELPTRKPMAAQVSVIDDDDYSLLKDLRIDIDHEEGGFSLCLWIYLLSSTRYPSTIISQTHPSIEGNVPFLLLNDEKKMTLFPFLFLHEEAPHPNTSASCGDLSCISAGIEFPLEKWVHVGCEVATNFMHLHIDGVMVREKTLSSSAKNDSEQDNFQQVILVGNDGVDGRLQGYVHYVRVLSLSSSATDHFLKNPPLELSLDGSCVSENHEVEEGGDGVWSVVGGKASCRRNFSLDVVLVDALGRSVDKEMELVASLVYADNGAPVEKPKDNAEAPLLTSYDGVEFPSTDRPIKLLNGRASFKLKISQLSSKCENRLFRVRFDSPGTRKYPFLEAYSRPIRCISRNRNNRPSSIMWKKPSSTSQQLDGPQSSGADEGSPEIQHNNGDANLQTPIQRESKYSHSPKRAKLAPEKSSMRTYANTTSEHPNDGSNPHAFTTHDDETTLETNLEDKLENVKGADDIPSDSESVHARNSAFKRMADPRNPISDLTLFKYCLEGIHGRSILLREVVTSSTDLDIAEFAEQVSLYTGCSHHRYQILIAKQLVQEGADIWKLVSQNNHHILWKNAAREIEKRFRKISRCSGRGLSGQDMDLLRRIAGSCDNITREEFDKMWHWLYPVAHSLSRDQINTIWECISPKWIEGLITKEEAEASLRGPIGLQKPGTFILRFPTSRSWPHPDAGSLIVTYVGADYTLHHKLLSLHDREINQKPLHQLLLAEPELSQLGRVTRLVTQCAGNVV
ncbi:SH2 domain-containing protein B-like [Tasmannia lanceolata]|uniref:SH2 domain-containing protein B-like n=1 Tax=Tasmannia lanceolata TaxID=3420 RepID=UPI0040641E56